VCILNKDNKIEHVYVYGAKETTFSDSENVVYESDKSEIHHVDQQIHYDDSIRVIKNKILRTIGIDTVSYKELYMFGYKDSHIDVVEAYKSITHQETEPFTHNNLVQFMSNVNLKLDIADKETYDLSDFDLEFKGPSEVIVKTPIGHKFSGEHDYLFSTNPMDSGFIHSGDTGAFYAFDNLLLFNFGKFINDTIYVCFASSALEYAKTKGLDESYFAKMYYPALYKDGIRSDSTLALKKQGLIEESRKALTDDVWEMYDTVDMFYDIHNKREPDSDFAYENEGIQYFNIGIKTDFVNLLPLDSIFKTIHATENMPFIKYNQGMRRESIYRLYSEKTAVSGNKIPFLPKADILRLSKESRKTGEITIYVKSENLKVIFKKDGSMQVQSTPTKPITTAELDKVLKTGLNPVIDEINGFIESTGYKIRKFESMSDPLVEVFDLKYVSSLKLERKMDISKYKGFISSVFNVVSASEAGADMRFKRVDNYHHMDKVDELINNEKKKHTEVYDIVMLLREEFELSEEEARTRTMAIYTNLDDDDAINNSGFPVSMKLIPSEKKMVIEVENITAIDYIDILKLYIDSILRMFQKPKSTHAKFNEISKKTVNYDKVDKPVVENVVAAVEIIRPFDADIFGEIEESEAKEEEEDDEDDFSNMDMEGGGADGDYEIIEKNVEGMNIKNPNPFYSRILERDPKLVLTRKVGKFNPYSKTCPPADNRQPVVLSKEELDNTNKDAYFGEPLSHRGNYYICPRYWSLKTDKTLTQAEVDEILKTNKKAIIPRKSKTVPEGAFIYEFNTPSEHIDGDGNYIPHYPGLQMDSHPETGVGIPCCFNKQEQKTQQNVRGDKNTYFLDVNKYPVTQNRRGFLPLSAQRFFKFDNNKCTLKTNKAMLRPNAPCLVRYGVEQTILDSFIGCFADIYSQFHKTPTTITNKQMREILVSAITIDDFLKYNLVQVFRSSAGAAVNQDLTPYKGSNFVRFIDVTRDIERNYANETIGAYKNFIEFLKDPSALIDHTYMWDILTMPHPKLIPDGLNLVILSIIGDDDRIEFICPPKMSDPSKGTLILLKHDEFYEPVYLCESKGGKFEDVKLFYGDSSNLIVKNALVEIERLANKYCKPKESMPAKYKFKSAKLDLHKTVDLLRTSGFDIVQQIVNYQSKAVGLIVQTSGGGSIFVPCKPSPIDLNMTLIKGNSTTVNIDFIDNAISNDYASTIAALKSVSDKTGGKIKCLPIQKLVNKNGLIFGVLTETNQFVRIQPKIAAASVDDELETTVSSNYIAAETSKREPDAERIQTIRNIKLESQFYSTFRSTIRTLMSYYENRSYKLEILNVIKDGGKHTDILKNIEEELRNIVKESIVFNEYSPEQVAGLSEISSCISNCKDKSHCSHDEDTCIFQLMVPKQNLVTQVDNERLYYGRLSDELARFKRIRSIMMEPIQYLNLSNISFKVNDNEILLLDSAMNSGYFNEVNVFNVSEYIKNITFDMARPDSAINYANVDEMK
jgi:hypothetical protein